MAKTRDGVEFVIGMTLHSEFGHAHATDDTFEVSEEFVNDCGRQTPVAILQRKGGSGGIGLNCLYSSPEARVADQVAFLERMKGQIDREIEHLKGGGDPNHTHFLFGTTINML